MVSFKSWWLEWSNHLFCNSSKTYCLILDPNFNNDENVRTLIFCSLRITIFLTNTYLFFRIYLLIPPPYLPICTICWRHCHCTQTQRRPKYEENHSWGPKKSGVESRCISNDQASCSSDVWTRRSSKLLRYEALLEPISSPHLSNQFFVGEKETTMGEPPPKSDPTRNSICRSRRARTTKSTGSSFFKRLITVLLWIILMLLTCFRMKVLVKCTHA